MTTKNVPCSTALTKEDLQFIGAIHQLILSEPKNSFTAHEISERCSTPPEQTQRYLDYLGDLQRECEPNPCFRGVAKVFLNDRPFYEALSDNPDVRRDYDFRAVNEGGRDLSPKNMFYYMWAWINMLERRCHEQHFTNNETILITHDCRYYNQEIVEAAKQAAMLRGYTVFFAFAEGTSPSCVSSYSHAVRIVKPMLSVFVTASHISLPLKNTVVGAKVSIFGTTGRLESISSKEIKVVTDEELQSLKKAEDLHKLVRPRGEYHEFDVSESHTRLAVVATMAALNQIPGTTLYRLAQDLKTAPEIEALLKRMVPTQGSLPFKGLRVVIEGAHTSSGPLTKKAFEALGAQTTLLHGDVQEIKGPHSADPSITNNLRDLFESMRTQKAHMGLGFDLDGDRGAIILPDAAGMFITLAPDKLGQVLIPFFLKECGYSSAPKPMYVRDCLSTDAILDQGKLSNITIDTTDAGYVYLKKSEVDNGKLGFLSVIMGEASGHAWLDVTGPFENPIVTAALFTAMCLTRLASSGMSAVAGDFATTSLADTFNALTIPYLKSPRFQPLFARQLIDEVAKDPANDTGWQPQSNSPIPQKLIGLCRSLKIKKLAQFFSVGKTFTTALGKLSVAKFDSTWDEESGIFRYGKISFLLNDLPVGSFVSRGSSNDPTAVQVWEVRGFDDLTWSGRRAPEEVVKARSDLIGGLVLTTCRDLGILELVDRPPSTNMTQILEAVKRYEASLHS